MAKPGAIISGLKAAQQAAAQPAATATLGGISPLVASYQQWTMGRPYGRPMPRDPMQFLTGAFGPLAPIQPVGIDQPQDGDERPQPRRWQYPVGWNMPIGEPGTEGIKLASFETLRLYADLYSVARACIQLRKAEIRSIGWDITPTKDAAKGMRADREAHRDFADRRAKTLRFFRRPDPNFSDFHSWLDAVLEEIFVVDALSLYLHPSRVPGKGLLGSDLAALDILDGSTIRPLLDLRGGTPRPPAPAYQQYLWGVPRVDLTTLMAGEDLEDLGEPDSEYRGDQLLYLPYTRRSWTPYGFPPLERAIIPVITGLRKQQFQMDFFNEGSIPGVFISPGDTSMTPNQLRELQDALNAIAGDPAWRHKIIVLPAGSKVDPQRPVELADMFDEVVMTQVCMAYDVMPMELGISPRVSSTQSSGAAHQMAKASQDINERKALKPLLLWLKSSIFDRVLQDICGQADMEWRWEGLEEDEDEETLTNLLVSQVSHGLASIDEARQEIGREPWGLPITSDPGVLLPTGFVPLGAIDPATGRPVGNQPVVPGMPEGNPAAAQAAKPGSGAPAGGQQQGTPAHAAQQATATQPRVQRPAQSTRDDVPKAALAELDALRRHLRKGRDITTWEPRRLPGHVVAAIAEDLAKGLTVDQAVGAARAALTKAGEAEAGDEAPKDQPAEGETWPGWEVDLALAEIYAARIADVLGDAVAARQLAEAWLSLPHGVTGPDDPRGWLEGQGIAGRLADALTPVLTDLWTEAWLVGDRAATAVLHAGPVDWGTWQPGDPRAAALLVEGERGLRDLLDAYGVPTIRGIADTRMGELADALRQALERGDSVDQLARDIRGILTAPQRAGVIAHTEIARAVSWAALQTYEEAHVETVAWATATDERVCVPCAVNEAAGDIPIGTPFPSGEPAPPAHPRCRCALVPGDTLTKADKTRNKVLRQLLKDYPADALDWARDADWEGPVEVPLDRIDFEDRDDWEAAHEPAKVERFKRKIQAGKLKPVILLRSPGKDKLTVIDGHHRSLAYRALGRPVVAYIGTVDRKTGPWLWMHDRQYPDDPKHPLEGQNLYR